jgi:hypothetical protein
LGHGVFSYQKKRHERQHKDNLFHFSKDFV